MSVIVSCCLRGE